MFNNLINKIKINFLYKKKILMTNLKKNETILIKKLIKLNLIKFILKKNNKFIVIFNLSKNNENIFFIKNIYKSSQYKNIKLKNLKKINKKNKILILTSNKGLLNNFEAEKIKTGGTAILYI